MSTTKQSSVAIVGAGPGGLATAVLLAGRGVNVTVFEAQESIGGRTSRLTLSDYSFDRGPTFFLMPHVLQEVFDAVGRRLDHEVDLYRLDPMYRLVLGRDGGEDIVLDATQDIEEMARRIGLISRSDGAKFPDFIEYNRRKLNAFEPILRRPIRSPLDLVRVDALKALPLLGPTRSVEDVNRRFFDDPSVQLAVGFQSKYLGMSPSDCPSLFSILPFIEYEYGVWHPRGGCNALMEALARVFVQAGGRIETGVPVEHTEFNGRRVRALHLGGRRAGDVHACDHVVINADATWALKHLVPQHLRPRYSDRSIDRKKYSCSTFMLYLGVDGEVDLPHHTVRTSPSYQQNLEDIGRRGGWDGSLSDQPSYYVCNASRTDHTLAPDGHSSIYMLMPTPNTRAPIDWGREAPRVRRMLLRQVRDDLGIDLAGRIRAEQMFTPDDWRNLNINFGATFNLAHSFDQLLHRRPLHRLPHCDGVWMAGGGTHPGSGLPVIFLSSQITADLLLQELGMQDRREAAEPYGGVASPVPGQAGQSALA